MNNSALKFSVLAVMTSCNLVMTASLYEGLVNGAMGSLELSFFIIMIAAFTLAPLAWLSTCGWYGVINIEYEAGLSALYAVCGWLLPVLYYRSIVSGLTVVSFGAISLIAAIAVLIYGHLNETENTFEIVDKDQLSD